MCRSYWVKSSLFGHLILLLFMFVCLHHKRANSWRFTFSLLMKWSWNFYTLCHKKLTLNLMSSFFSEVQKSTFVIFVSFNFQYFVHALSLHALKFSVCLNQNHSSLISVGSWVMLHQTSLLTETLRLPNIILPVTSWSKIETKGKTLSRWWNVHQQAFRLSLRSDLRHLTINSLFKDYIETQKEQTRQKISIHMNSKNLILLWFTFPRIWLWLYQYQSRSW